VKDRAAPGKTTAASEARLGVFLALRTPRLPGALARELGEGLRAPGAADLATALAADRVSVRARLRAVVERPEVREALFVASPSLIESLDEWLSDPDSEGGAKVERALVRYLYRMAGRATPFGLFAGCSVGRFDEASLLDVGTLAEHRRHTRLDMDYLFALTSELGRDPELRAALSYRPNSSLYPAAGELRYVEVRVLEGARSYHLTSVEVTPYLEATLARAASGATRATLAAALVDEEIDEEEALGFVDELIDAQMLISEMQPMVTGSEPVHELIAQLGRLPPGQVASARAGDRA
jgi:lantibiotic biosynthesis protein